MALVLPVQNGSNELLLLAQEVQGVVHSRAIVGMNLNGNLQTAAGCEEGGGDGVPEHTLPLTLPLALCTLKIKKRPI